MLDILIKNCRRNGIKDNLEFPNQQINLLLSRLVLIDLLNKLCIYPVKLGRPFPHHSLKFILLAAYQLLVFLPLRDIVRYTLNRNDLPSLVFNRYFLDL